MYKVKQEDLIGDIKDFPIEVVQRMIEYQVEQGNKANVVAFQKRNRRGFRDEGFEWDNTKEKYSFWNNVIDHKNFNIFFKRYPKQTIKNTNVYFRGDRNRGHEIISTLEKLGGDNSFFQLAGTYEDSLYYISKENNYIKACDLLENNLISLIKYFYTELTLPAEIIEIDGIKYNKKEVLEKLKDLQTY